MSARVWRAQRTLTCVDVNAGIRLPQTLADVIHLQAVNIKIRLNCFINDVASIPLERRGHSIQGFSLVGFQTKADCFLIYGLSILPRNTG